MFRVWMVPSNVINLLVGSADRFFPPETAVMFDVVGSSTAEPLAGSACSIFRAAPESGVVRVRDTAVGEPPAVVLGIATC